MKFEYFYSSSFLFIFIWLVNGLVNHVALHTIFVSSTFLCTLLSRTFIITSEADSSTMRNFAKLSQPLSIGAHKKSNTLTHIARPLSQHHNTTINM